MPKSITDERYVAIIDRLASARKSAGLTQDELASRLARPQQFVSKYEGRERRLDIIEFFDVADAIGTDGLAILREVLE